MPTGHLASGRGRLPHFACVHTMALASSFPKPLSATAVVCNRLSPRAYVNGRGAVTLAQSRAEVKTIQTPCPCLLTPLETFSWAVCFFKPSLLPFSRNQFPWTLPSPPPPTQNFLLQSNNDVSSRLYIGKQPLKELV